jgi:hypothetical protein
MPWTSVSADQPDLDLESIAAAQDMNIVHKILTKAASAIHEQVHTSSVAVPHSPFSSSTLLQDVRTISSIIRRRCQAPPWSNMPDALLTRCSFPLAVAFTSNDYSPTAYLMQALQNCYAGRPLSLLCLESLRCRLLFSSTAALNTSSLHSVASSVFEPLIRRKQEKSVTSYTLFYQAVLVHCLLQLHIPPHRQHCRTRHLQVQKQQRLPPLPSAILVYPPVPLSARLVCCFCGRKIAP